jgi:hypothetical protein
MATAAPPIGSAMDLAPDESTQLHDLLHMDQTTVVSLFFLIVAGLLMILLVPQINETPDVVSAQNIAFPSLPAYLLDFSESNWAFDTAYDTTISTLTLGIEPPSPPPTINMWRWWDQNWSWQMLNPVALRVPTVSFALLTLFLYLGVCRHRCRGTGRTCAGHRFHARPTPANTDRRYCGAGRSPHRDLQRLRHA